jgi:hypothetical protein
LEESPNSMRKTCIFNLKGEFQAIRLLTKKKKKLVFLTIELIAKKQCCSKLGNV